MISVLKKAVPASVKLRLYNGKEYLKGFISPVEYVPYRWSTSRIRGSMCRNNLTNDLLANFHYFNLDRLALIYGTDKFGSHFYTPHYHKHLKKYRWKRINLLEIGAGGYKNKYDGGHSLRTWKKYFPFGKITAIDIFDKSPLQERRITILQGSQADEKFLHDVIDKIGTPDVIIDDGSHINEHVITSFEILFPLLKDDGLYIIEDTQTSYWEKFGGSMDKRDQTNMMNYFKEKIDGLNHVEFIEPGFIPGYTDTHILSITFYHNMIFIQKGNNTEPSNKVTNNEILND